MGDPSRPQIVMMDLRDQFSAAVEPTSMTSWKHWKPRQRCLRIAIQGIHERDSGANFSQKKKKKLYHAAILMAEFCIRERYLPVMDAMAPRDTFTLDVSEWPVAESKEVQIIWKNRVRTHEFMVYAEAEDGEPLDEDDIMLALQQLDLPVIEVSPIIRQKGHRTIPSTHHIALLKVDKVEPFIQKEFMFGDKPITLTLLWKPHGRLPGTRITDYENEQMITLHTRMP
eukprot:jgi/Picre1/30991/NNA_006349.t1